MVQTTEACASSALLAERVRERSQNIEFVQNEGDVPRIVVDLHAQPTQGLSIELRIRWPDNQVSERQLTARSCDSALDALALLLAMTLDPSMRLDARSASAGSDGGMGEGYMTKPPRPRERAPTSQPTDSAPIQSAQDSPPPAQVETNQASQPSPTTEEDVAVRKAQAQPHATSELQNAQEPAPAASATAPTPHPLGIEALSLGIGAQLALEIAPAAMIGVELYGLLSLNGVRLWAPALQLQLSHSWVGGVVEQGGTAKFALDAAELGICPLGVRLQPVSARTCVTGTVGRLLARGADSYAAQGHKKLWASMGGALLLSLQLGRWVELQLGAELAAPMLRYGFEFRPELFHRVPPIYFYGHLGAGVRFP